MELLGLMSYSAQTKFKFVLYYPIVFISILLNFMHLCKI